MMKKERKERPPDCPPACLFLPLSIIWIEEKRKSEKRKTANYQRFTLH